MASMMTYQNICPKGNTKALVYSVEGNRNVVLFDLYVGLSDLYVDLSDLYVDLSDLYVVGLVTIHMFKMLS